MIEGRIETLCLATLFLKLKANLELGLDEDPLLMFKLLLLLDFSVLSSGGNRVLDST
jgi:hypothetical protein